MVWTYTTADSFTSGNYIDWTQSNTTTSAMANNLCDWDSIMMTGTAIPTPIAWQYYTYVPYRWTYSTQERTQEQIERERINQELLNKRKAENEDIEKAAKERATTLLLEYLDNENKQRLLENKPLEVESKLFKDIKYHIPISYGRIKAWKENKIIAELCLMVKEPERLPLEDVILTKLLHVLNDEKNMLKTANHFNVQENLLTGLN